MCTMKLTFCPQLWYVDIIDQFCGMLERGDRADIGVRPSATGGTRKTVVFLHIPHPKKSMND